MVETRVGATSAIALLSDCKPLDAVACIGDHSDLLPGIRSSGDADHLGEMVAGHTRHLGSQHFGLSSPVIPTPPRHGAYHSGKVKRRALTTVSHIPAGGGRGDHNGVRTTSNGINRWRRSSRCWHPPARLWLVGRLPLLPARGSGVLGL